MTKLQEKVLRECYYKGFLVELISRYKKGKNYRSGFFYWRVKYWEYGFDSLLKVKRFIDYGRLNGRWHNCLWTNDMNDESQFSNNEKWKQFIKEREPHLDDYMMTPQELADFFESKTIHPT